MKKYRIRRLSPKECFRLMGCCEKDIETLTHCGVSESAQYKLAGNSIVSGTGNYTTDEDGKRHYDGCLYNIFRKMLLEPESEEKQSGQLSLF